MIFYHCVVRLYPVNSLSNPQTTRIIAVTPDHIDIAGDGNSALFLAQVLFWWKAAGRKRFYKFNSPCEHALYRVGDSWAEELRLKRTMLATARRRVANKVRISSNAEIQGAFEGGALIVYGTDENHLTWYLVNEGALASQSPTLYSRLLATDTIHPAPTPHKAPPTKPQVSHRPVSVASPIASTPTSPECITSTFGDVEGQHSPMQGSDIGFNTEMTTKTASETNLQKTPKALTPLPTPKMQVGEGGAQNQLRAIAKNIFAELQQRGVQTDPARLIALRAARSGWTVEKTLEVFEAHLLDAERAGARSPIGVAVSRMLDGDAITPAPQWAIAEILRRKQEQEWQERRERDLAARIMQVENEESNAEGVAVRDDPLNEISPLKSLWDCVLHDIKSQVTRATFEQRFRDTWLEKRGTTYVVCASDPNTVEWLAHRLSRLVAEGLQRWGGAAIQPQFACA